MEVVKAAEAGENGVAINVEQLRVQDQVTGKMGGAGKKEMGSDERKGLRVAKDFGSGKKAAADACADGVVQLDLRRVGALQRGGVMTERNQFVGIAGMKALLLHVFESAWEIGFGNEKVDVLEMA